MGTAGTLWWLWAWGLWMGFNLLLMVVYPTFISWGFYLVLVVWGIPCLGVALEFVAHLKFKRLSLMLYLLMGWLVLIAAGPMLDHVPAGGLWWLLAGGLCYSGGVIFYLWHHLRYHHLIWHCFVVAGSVCHFWSVYRYVLSPQ